MADTKISALTDGVTAAASDRLPAVRDPSDSPSNVWITPEYIKDYIRGLANTFTAGQTIALGTITDPATILALTATWNDAADTFTGIDLNVTDTASAAASILMNLRIGGNSVFAVRKNGAAIVYPTSGTGLLLTGNGNGVVTSSLGTDFTSYGPYGVRLQANNSIEWSATTDGRVGGGLVLVRDAADILAQRRGANAQAQRLYGTFTDTGNFRRLALAVTTGGVCSIAPEGAGTGASGNVLHISGLPTSNPGAGILWNDSGTVKVGT